MESVHLLRWSLILLLSLRAVLAFTPVASCVNAGFTGCCDSQEDGDCLAPPTYCLCDPYCREYNDCCPDIDVICPPDPVPPDFLLAVEPTHHTIRLLWRRPTLASDHVNQSYSIIYWEINDSNTTTNVSINQTVLESSGEIVELILKDLTPGQLYQWRIEARTKIMSILSIVSNFSTLPPVQLKNLEIDVLNTSSVLVSWQPPQLPSAIKLCQYTLHYSGTRTHNTSDIPLDTGLLDLLQPSTIVSDLKSDIFYHFWMEVAVEDGGEYILYSGNRTVYLPDTVTVQLRGGPFKLCEHWKDETEINVLHEFHNITYEALSHGTVIREVDYGGKWVIERETVFCVDTSSSESQVVYRAVIYSSPHLATDIIQSLLEHRVKSGDLTRIELDNNCPVIVVRWSQPLCSSSKPSSTDCTSSSSVQSQTDSLAAAPGNMSCDERVSCEGVIVTVPLLITALIAEAFLILFMVLLSTALLLVVRRRRHAVKKVKIDHNQSAQSNQYS